jgi:hypothetical protein
MVVRVTLVAGFALLASGVLWLIGAGSRRLAAHARRVSREVRDGEPVPPTDPFDEASWESFPASDPPARMTPLR